MKKNILRVISLVLAASMIFAFAACKQEIQVRFVDKDGNDIDLEALFAGTATPGSSNNVVPSTTQAPVTTAPPTGDTTTTAPPTGDTNTTVAPPTGDTNTTSAPVQDPTPPASGLPSTTQEIFEFYKKAANDIAQNGAAGYDKKEWQAISSLNLTGLSLVDNAIAGAAGNYMTKEADATVQANAKGSDEAKNRFPEVILTDVSKIASATCTQNANGNYNIKIIMQDEDTPKRDTSFLRQITNSLLLWEDIDAELQNIDIISSYNDIHVIYKGFLIDAEITPDGKFVSMDHTASVDIQIGEAKVLVATLKNKSGHLDNYCQYRNFAY